MIKLKNKLSKITDKYIDIIKMKKNGENALEELANGAELAGKYVKELSDELVDESNKFMKDNDIENTKPAEKLIEEELQRFTENAFIG